MFAIYEEYLSQIRAFAVNVGLEDFRVARDEFHRLTGLFEDGEPWFELRMGMFHDWYLLDRPNRDGMTPLERYLVELGPSMAEAERRQLKLLTVTLRSVFRIVHLSKTRVLLNDLSGGGQWLAKPMIPMGGMRKNDIIDTRIMHLNGQIVVGSGTILHPEEAYHTILAIVTRARAEGMPPRELVDHLDKMRLKLDRYANVRVQHVYQYPGEATL